MHSQSIPITARAPTALAFVQAKTRGDTGETDFKRMRTITLNRGPKLDSLGIDLAVREATPPDSGTYAVIKGVKHGADAGVAGKAGKGDATLRRGDRIVKVAGNELSKIEPGQFLALLAAPILELEVYNEIDERAEREAAAEAAARAAEKAAEEQAERERRSAELRAAEDALIADWLADAKRRKSALHGKRASLATKVDKTLFRTVCVDRRPESVSDELADGDDGLGLNARDYGE